ncbi:hypothetical protein LTR53_014299 [Teratosphaeriaceae sp. CCFEE 6253]|nr:hypothetical protein LTR53_014299 [Teratosphaeriaceae sp. CCFEE 6253]
MAWGGTPEVIPVPIAWAPSTYWDGNDGLWNTFIVSAGTPPQSFRVLPSTAGQETWLPNPQGCTDANPNNPGYCGYLRGALPINGANSSGFHNNETSTWDLIGPYTLDAQEAELGYIGNGLFGFDTVYLNGTSTSLNQTKQVIASVGDLDYWLGIFGLGPKASNFTNFNDPIENYMRGLVNTQQIPSLSWGYTAGAHYRDQAHASLTLGGYDTNRFETSNMTFEMDSDNSRPLQVAIQSIIGENTLGGAGIQLLPTETYHFIDSTVPHIWLPEDAIQAFVDNFGLTYDNDTDLFLINDTMRQTMLNNNPGVTFVLGASKYSSDTINIELPYAAFDMQASYPFYQNATNYFPIRRAANSSQCTMGRTFLQEAYLIADFDRNNFTVAQTSFTNMDSQHLVAIDKYVPPPTTSTSTTPSATPKAHGIGTGVIVGAVIAAIAGVTFVVLGVWFFIRRNKRKHQPLPTSDPEKPDGVVDGYTDDRKDDTRVSQHVLVEAPDNHKRPSELASPAMVSEVEGDMGKSRGRSGMFEMAGEGHDSGTATPTIGGDAHTYELAGNEPARHEVGNNAH